MKAAEFTPIRYNRRQVALMIRVVRFYRHGARPTYRSMGLERDGGGFVWILR